MSAPPPEAAHIRSLAERVCTEAELEAWRLVQRGMSQRAISLALGISRSSVRDRVESAARKVADALEEP